MSLKYEPASVPQHISVNRVCAASTRARSVCARALADPAGLAHGTPLISRPARVSQSCEHLRYRGTSPIRNPTPLGQPEGRRHMPTVGFWYGAVSYERGSPAPGMRCANGAGSYLRLIDSCITQLKARGLSRTCNESEEEEEEPGTAPRRTPLAWGRAAAPQS